jgi:hypothetical protein
MGSENGELTEAEQESLPHDLPPETSKNSSPESSECGASIPQVRVNAEESKNTANGRRRSSKDHSQ